MVWKTVNGDADKVKMRIYKNDWMQARRRGFIEKMGPCLFCGETEYEKMAIHNIDPSIKEDHRIWSWKPERIEAELIKCIAMCQPCHNKFHTILKKKQPEHGTNHAYDQYKCRCDECRKAHSEKHKEYKLRKTG